MAHYKAFTLSENDNPLNRAALEWLKEAKADAEPYYLHLLNLAARSRGRVSSASSGRRRTVQDRGRGAIKRTTAQT